MVVGGIIHRNVGIAANLLSVVVGNWQFALGLLAVAPWQLRLVLELKATAFAIAGC
jgi:hypothetical protein